MTDETNSEKVARLEAELDRATDNLDPLGWDPLEDPLAITEDLARIEAELAAASLAEPRVGD